MRKTIISIMLLCSIIYANNQTNTTQNRGKAYVKFPGYDTVEQISYDIVNGYAVSGDILLVH